MLRRGGICRGAIVVLRVIVVVVVVVGKWRECGIDDDHDLRSFCFVAQER